MKDWILRLNGLSVVAQHDTALRNYKRERGTCECGICQDERDFRNHP